MRAIWGGTLILATACALNPAPVPVEGARADVVALAGEWFGEYGSAETGRSGSILFTLEPGRDTAYGDVVMIPREAGVTYDDATLHTMAHAAPRQQVLKIRFVRVVGNSVVGTIEPYQSPDCECQLLTTFRGEMSGDRIDGTFTIHHSGHESQAQKGTWWVKRTKH